MGSVQTDFKKLKANKGRTKTVTCDLFLFFVPKDEEGAYAQHDQI